MSRDHFITRTHQFLCFVALLSYSSCFQNLTARQFRNEKQPVALIKSETGDQYEIAKPSLSKDDKLIFADVDQNSIKYMCSSSISRNVVRVEKEASSNEYEYHQCEYAPNAVLRTVPKGHELTFVWTDKNLKIYQIGYEIENSDKKFSAKGCVEKVAASIQRQNKNLPKPPKGPFAPLVWFIYDDKTSLPALVHYKLRSAESLFIETNYIMDYNNINPLTGEKINTDRVDIEINHAMRSSDDAPQIQKQRLAARLGLLNRKLVPHDDLLLFSWKSAAFYGALTAPMWKMHRIKWDLVEQFVRRLANAAGDLDIYTGVTGALGESTMSTYWSYNGNEPRDLGFVIPAYFWKIVINPKLNFGAIIVLNNNPLEQNSEKICTDIGYKNNWIFVDKDYITGSVYVCELDRYNMSKLSQHFADAFDNLVPRNLKNELPLQVLNQLINNIYWTDYELKPNTD